MNLNYSRAAKRRLFSTMLVLAGLMVPALSSAQSGPEPLWTKLQEQFKQKHLSLGMLIQIVGDVQPERSFSGNSGFNIANMRLNVGGELDQGFGYFLQANFIRSPAVLDAKLFFRLSPALTLDAGLFKAPFSTEFLTSAAGIDFVNRAQVVSSLTAGRQLGIQIRGRIANGAGSYSVGAFNGNGYGGNNNDNNDFMIAGRVELTPNASDAVRKLVVGFNAATSEDDDTRVLGRDFTGRRTLFGADLRWTEGDWLVSGEVIGANLNRDVGPNQKPWGYHATVGRMLTPRSQLLARWDSFSADGRGSDADLLVFGYNLWPTQASEVQVNYIVDTDNSDLKFHQVLINFQVGF